MSVCRNCGRGPDWKNDDFTCDICGAKNHADGSVSYDGSRDAVEDMKERIDDYDARYDK